MATGSIPTSLDYNPPAADGSTHPSPIIPRITSPLPGRFAYPMDPTAHASARSNPVGKGNESPNRCVHALSSDKGGTKDGGRRGHGGGNGIGLCVYFSGTHEAVLG